MADEGEGYGCVAVIVFFGVWIFCTSAFGPLGFLLGWMPAAVLAVIWPLVAFVVVGIFVLIALLITILGA